MCFKKYDLKVGLPPEVKVWRVCVTFLKMAAPCGVYERSVRSWYRSSVMHVFSNAGVFVYQQAECGDSFLIMLLSPVNVFRID